MILLLTVILSGCVKPALLRSTSTQKTLIGCLTQGANPDTFSLADGKTGAKTIVTGNPQLILHAGNHAVRLVGFQESQTFRTLWIEHISVGCKIPFQ